MKRSKGVFLVLATGFAVAFLFSASRASAQCSSGYYSGGWSYPGGYAINNSAPVYQQAVPSGASFNGQAAPLTAPSNGQIAQSNGLTYQSFSATPSSASAPAPAPTYVTPSYPTYDGNYGYGYYGAPYYYGGSGYGYSSGWRSLDNANHHGIP
jgi:hypothetical protein